MELLHVPSICDDDLELIVESLRQQAKMGYDVLSQKNARDSEWDTVIRMESLANEIELQLLYRHHDG